MLQARDLLLCQHDAGTMGKTRHKLAGLGEDLIEGFRAPDGDLRFDLAALVIGDIADLEQAVDEQPKT